MPQLFRNTYSLLLICLFICLQACEPNDLVPIDSSQYAPVDVGRYWVYEVQEEQYSLTEAPVLTTHYLKETIGELLSAGQAGKTYKLIRYKRNRSSDSWRTDSVWTIEQQPDKLIRTENSTSFVRLSFPISSNTTWNQNEYNVLPAAIYRYELIGSLYQLDSYVEPNTIHVVNKQNDSSAISLHKQSEVYAYQKGLIFKESTALAYCQSSPDCIGKGQIAYGYRRKQVLLETGKQ